MAIRNPYGADDVFATPEEARREGASVTEIPLSAFKASLTQPEVQEMVRAAAQLRPDLEAELPVFD